MDLLIVIDVQNEFVNKDTKKYVEKISSLIKSKKYDDIIFTRFINSKDNPAYTKCSWYGCMDEESYKLAVPEENYKVFDKATYNSFTKEVKEYIDNNKFDNIYLCGVDVDCCVLSTAFNMFDANYNVYVLKDYVYSMISEKAKDIALEIIRRCIGTDYVI